MSSKLKWGIMGNANIARVCVIPAIQKSHNGIVHALASRFPKRAAKVAEKHHINRVYADYTQLIEDPAIEAIYIPLPNHLHFYWTKSALGAGKHVLCEKPLACNAHQAEEMVDAAKSAGRLLMEAFMYLHHPRTTKIFNLVKEKVIGSPRLIRASFCYSMSEKELKNPHNTRLRSEMGGGALLDVGCYCVSIARRLYGAEPIEVQCQACYNSNGIDLHTTGMLKFSGQRIATIEASFISGLQQTYTTVGKAGVIEMPNDAFIPWEKDVSYTLRLNNADVGTPVAMPGADQYKRMVEHFVYAAKGTVKPIQTPDDSVNNLRVLDALSEAANTRLTVRI